MEDFGLEADDCLEGMCGKVFSTIKGMLVIDCAFCDRKYLYYENFLLHLSETHLITARGKRFSDAPLIKLEKDEDDALANLNANVGVENTDIDCNQGDPLDVDFTEQEEKDVNYLIQDDSFGKDLKYATHIKGGVIDAYSETSHNTEKLNEVLTTKPKKRNIITKTKSRAKKSREQAGRVEAEISTIKCLKCPVIFSDIQEFRNHMKDHSNYICPKCSAGFLSKRNFDAHMDCTLPERPHKCGFCDFGYSSKSKLKSHMRDHCDEEGYKCKECTKRFNSRLGLRRHRNTHLQDKKYKCHICGATMTNKSNMNAHINRHSKENKKFECQDCALKFFSRTELMFHSRAIHTQERPYLCSDCGKSFYVLSKFTIHKERHHTARERNIDCPTCSKAFFNKFDLRRHQATHLNERNHVCSQCNATFKTQETLGNHLKIHENKRAYRCNICEKGFNQRPALFTHMKRIHGNDL